LKQLALKNLNALIGFIDVYAIHTFIVGTITDRVVCIHLV